MLLITEYKCQFTTFIMTLERCTTFFHENRDELFQFFVHLPSRSILRNTHFCIDPTSPVGHIPVCSFHLEFSDIHYYTY